jgi:peptidyl-dipeptidase Dcp
MRNLIVLLLPLFLIAACGDESKKDTEDETSNPLLSEFNTPYGVPDFDAIKTEHYLPAIKAGMEKQNELIEVIVSNADAPTYENTIAAYDHSGLFLSRNSSVFHNLLSAHSNEETRELAKEISPLLSEHRDNIMLNEALFKRIKAVFEQLDELDLTTEQKRLTQKLYTRFARGGADLPDDKKERMKEINSKLSSLTLQFGQNILAENNKFELIIDNEEDLSGLPQQSINAAAKAADEEGKWKFTLHKPSLIPFLQYSDKRDLRKKMFLGYANMGNNDDENDNKEIINEIVNLRLEKAKLFGFDKYADYVLDDRMAKNSENVYELLDQLWKPALETAKADAEEFQKLLEKDIPGAELEAWDWWYYAEKLRKEKYAVNEQEVKQYFSLENVLAGLFDTAEKLFGLQMEEADDIPKYHEDVRVFRVKEADGSLTGILYMDFFVRESKRSGAWMTSFRKQYYMDGERVIPVIMNVLNFPAPEKGKPALLSFDNVTTLFHEFGHGLHGLLSDVETHTLSGTSTARDFVELPSQIMENWASHPDVIVTYAKHYETGEPIPADLLEKLDRSSKFNEGFRAVEYLAASYLDLSWHSLTEGGQFDVNAFEEKAMDKIGLIDEIIPRYRSGYFSHIFSGGYAVGYYSYIWAEVLDADAFEAFKENGLFDQATALAFRENVLSKGGSDDEMKLYEQFRGHTPNIQPLLERKGFDK